MTTTKSFMNHKKNYRKNDEEDDNLTLADIRSLKITSPEEKVRVLLFHCQYTVSNLYMYMADVE